MGEDAPEAVILTCPGCSTQFRLKPKKGRLPDGPVACPKCATDIPVVDSNLSEAADQADEEDQAPLAGGAPVPPSADAEEESDDFERFPDDDHSFADINLSENASRQTGPKQTFLGMGPSSLKAVIGDESSTASPDEPTQLVDRENLGALRESSAVDEDADDGGFKESPTSGRLRRPRQLDESDEDEFTRQTSEQTSVSESDLRETAESTTFDGASSGSTGREQEATASAKTEAIDDGEASSKEDTSTQMSERPDVAETAENDRAEPEGARSEPREEPSKKTSKKKNVLGKLNLKKKLAARLKKDKKGREDKGEDKKDREDRKKTESGAQRGPAESRTQKSDDKITLDSDDQKTGKKPSLSELLKKAREKSKSGSGLPRPRQSTTRNQRPKPTGEKLDRALQDIADETAKALTGEEAEAAPTQKSERNTERLGSVGGTERMGKVSGPADEKTSKKSSKEMMDMLRRKVAEEDQPGAASERRGSGYIRLPTAEIQDVLGQGTYRLRVEDIVYEPVDKEGLTQLIKRGVLLGAAEIAEADGDWMPVQEHPVFHELRRKMAKEAHDLLSDYRAGPESSEAATPEEKPGSPPPMSSEQPSEEPDAKPEKRASLSDADMDGIPTMEAELEEEAATEAPRAEGAPEDAEPTEAEPEEAEEAMEPAAEEPAAAEPEEQPAADQSFDLPKSESSIEFPAGQPEQQPAEGAPSETPATSDEDTEAGTPKSYPAIDASRGTAEPEVAAADSEFAPVAGKGRRALIIVLAILAAGAVLVAVALSPLGRPYLEEYVGPIGETSGDEQGGGAAGKTPAADEEADQKFAAAVDAASSEVTGAARVPLSNAREVATFADQMASSDDEAAAATLLGAVHESAPDDRALTERYIDLLIRAGRYTKARREIAEVVAVEGTSPELTKTFAEATTSDPALGAYETVTLEAGQNADAFRAYPRWENMNFKVVEAGTITGVFKPSQSGWEDGWRDEVAAWRLCEIMVCHFEIPRNRVARVSRAQLEKLLQDGESKAQATYRKRLEQLDWQTETTDDGEVEVVYGTLKDWQGEWAPFPIELTDVWRPLLATNGADLDQPPRRALSGLENVQDGRFYEALVQELDGATTRSIARELSTILVFDYLTNNWDRFVSDESRFGVNNPFSDGHFVSLNNGSAFQTRASTRVKGRFGWTSRFSASTVASLNLMKPEFVTKALYPDPSALDQAKLEVFWEQRTRALERVESLSQTRGEDAVVAFD